jgi:hypothetical protein
VSVVSLGEERRSLSSTTANRAKKASAAFWSTVTMVKLGGVVCISTVERNM